MIIKTPKFSERFAGRTIAEAYMAGCGTETNSKHDEFYIKSHGKNLIDQDYGTLVLSAENTSGDCIWELQSDNVVIETVEDNKITLRGLKNGEATIVCKSVKDPITETASTTIQVSNQKGREVKRNVKVLLFGNSILHHGPLPSCGWNNSWGMAASDKKNDYQHRLCDHYMSNSFGKIEYAEGGYQNFEAVTQSLGEGNGDSFDYTGKFKKMCDLIKDNDADIVIFQFGDNVNQSSPLFTPKQYQRALEALIDQARAAKNDIDIIMTNAYYAKSFTTEGASLAAESKGVMLVPIQDLSVPSFQGGNDGTGSTETGGFAGGVRTHPGDKGMEIIAVRIFNQIQKVINKYPLEVVSEGMAQALNNTSSDSVQASGNDYDPEATKFTFAKDNAMQGFTSYNLFHFKAMDGFLMGTATDVKTTGANMKFISPKLNISSCKTFKLKMQHSAFDDNTEIKIVLNNKYSFTKKVVSKELTEYTFDLSQVKETVELLEIYPTNIDSNLKIESIAFE